MIRLAFTGPESSGKTTLSKWFAKEFNCPCVEEVARDYLTVRNGVYVQADLDTMAELQVLHWNELGEIPLAIYDTEMTVFEVWSTVKYGEVSPKITQLLDNQQINHYFLCSPDIPWEADPLRENPTNRDELFTLYFQSLTQKNVPFTVLFGSVQHRQEQVREVMKSVRN